MTEHVVTGIIVIALVVSLACMAVGYAGAGQVFALVLVFGLAAVILL